MNGHYRIPIPPDVKPEDHPRVKALLRAIDPGAAVTITRIEGQLSVHHLGQQDHVLGFAEMTWGKSRGLIAQHYAEITATGGKAKRRQAGHVAIMPPIRTWEQCHKRLTEAEQSGDSEDIAYWRELEALAGQREHFKPGLSDDTRTSDDEIAPSPVPRPEVKGWWFQDGRGRSYWVARKTEAA